MNNYLACPKCHEPLNLENKTYRCSNNHCYDLAKSGYINLLLNPDKATTNPGDSKESLIARKDYLNSHHYDSILNQVIELIKKYAKYQDIKDLNILDLGCGEGYYTYGIYQSIPANISGLDISKVGVNMATKYTKEITWLVGNSKNIPILDHSLDFVTALFTVVNLSELQRVLKENGKIIHVTANSNHLIEFKQMIYDEIIEKSDKFIRLDLPIVEQFDFTKKELIENREDVLNLLMMTPHYYHIATHKRHILDELESLEITIDIKITVYDAGESLL